MAIGPLLTPTITLCNRSHDQHRRDRQLITLTINSQITRIISRSVRGLLCYSGRIPRLSLIRHSLYVGVVEKLLPHHSRGSSSKRWSRNTLRMEVCGCNSRGMYIPMYVFVLRKHWRWLNKRRRMSIFLV